MNKRRCTLMYSAVLVVRYSFDLPLMTVSYHYCLAIGRIGCSVTLP